MKRFFHAFRRITCRLSLPDITISPIKALLLRALLLCLLSVVLARRSLTGAVGFFLTNPLALVYGIILITLPLSLCLLVRRRAFALRLLSAAVLIIAIINCILQSYRTAPLTAIDFALLPSVWSILLKYLHPLQITAILCAAAGGTALLIHDWKCCARSAVHLRRGLCSVLALCLCTLILHPLFKAALDVPDVSESTRDTARRFGYVYCFARSLFDRGIDKPPDYSGETVDSILEQLSNQVSTETAEHPNIIFLQLESFFDVNTLSGADFKENPLPVFTELEQSYPSGLLHVPSLATGTANTEFEVLTGMNLAYFGLGEYPYQTVLQTETCESMAYNLRALGYTAHAIHNHSGDFYDRAHVFSNLGFDTFTSVEYMQNVQRNPIGWAKDSVLTAEILKALGSTPGEDFIYTISVQAHGQYPKDAEHEMETSTPFSEDDRRAAFAYYLSQIKEVDTFLGELTNALERYGHPTVLVLFGDHLPSLGLTEEDLPGGDLYATPYVIWSNTGLTAPNRSLEAYQLSAYVQKLLGMQSGLFPRLHQQLAGKDDYQHALEMLQYDYLYGGREAFSGVDPYLPTHLQMGAVPIELTGLSVSGQCLTVYGRGFTPYSRILVNGRQLDTVLEDGVLVCTDAAVTPGELIRVAQALY